MANLIENQVFCTSLNAEKFNEFKTLIRDAENGGDPFEGLDVRYDDVFIQGENEKRIDFIFISRGEPYIDFFRVLSERYELILNCNYKEPLEGFYGFFSIECGSITEQIGNDFL